jgi:hypothetical protein
MEPLTRCDNGHYYDAKKHTSCPYCGVQNLGIDIEQTMAKRSGNAGFEVNVTKPLSQGRGREEVGVTKGIYKQKMGVDPVAGWLVSISGPEKGLDYRITAERNFIGRAESMDIRITNDEAISRENHASVSYSPKNHTFRLYPGDSKGLVYLNNEEVLTPELLKPFDVIEMGQSRLLFVPLCGENFHWDKLNQVEDSTEIITDDN